MRLYTLPNQKFSARLVMWRSNSADDIFADLGQTFKTLGSSVR